MSRSHKKNPVCGITNAPSEKQDKRLANRRLRHAVNQLVRSREHRFRELLCNDVQYPQDNDWQCTQPYWVYPLLREVSNVWGMAKDGKQYAPDWSRIYRK